MSGSYARVGIASVVDEARGRAPGEFAGRIAALRDRAGRVNLGADAVHLAAEIAALDSGLDDGERYAMVLLVLASLASLGEGSTRLAVARSGETGRLIQLLEALAEPDERRSGREAAAKAIARLLAPRRAAPIIGRAPDSRTPLLLIGGWLYHQRIHAAEARLARNLAAMLRAGPPEFSGKRRVAAAIAEVAATAAVADGNAARLTDSQCAAISGALRNRLAVISGGPGSGKTTVVVAILRVLVRLGVEPASIALCAPTGKAAYRMREMIAANIGAIEKPAAADASLRAAAIEPSTIHRLLGYSPSRGDFRHHRNNPLAFRVVIVDEGSMLDLILMERLAGALDPAAQLIVVGDADQLPSVTAGAVLRDLVPPQGDRRHPMAASAMRLEGTHRTAPAGASGDKLRALADAIKRGDTALMEVSDSSGQPLVAARERAGEIAFDAAEFFECKARGLEEFLARWREAADLERAAELAAKPFAVEDWRIAPEDRERANQLFGIVSHARILTVLRASAHGAEGVNARMHALACSRAKISPARHTMIAGEPVIVLRNYYERQLFNGDHGIVVSVAAKGSADAAPCAAFARDGEFVCYRLGAMQDRLGLAYAITVHKAQGSEFERIAIVLPERSESGGVLPILTRELLYTAVTRARRSAVIVGARELVGEAVANPVVRDSGLAAALESALRTAVR